MASTDAEKVAALHEAFSEYQQALRDRAHGGVAADKLVDRVAAILDRSCYEFQGPPCHQPLASCSCPPGAEQPGSDIRFVKVLPNIDCPVHGWWAVTQMVKGQR